MGEQRVLHLTIKKKWYDMIASGEKPEEYREIKPYWIKRLLDEIFKDDTVEQFFEWLNRDKGCVTLEHIINRFDIVLFKNGYQKDSPTLSVEWKGLEVRAGNPKWGAEEGKKYFVTKLGKVLINTAIG